VGHGDPWGFVFFCREDISGMVGKNVCLEGKGIREKWERSASGKKVRHQNGNEWILVAPNKRK
jgi:hypothetical protein